MKVTYIGHSGVALEWKNCGWVIDYFKGTIPEMAGKRIFVFSSHFHGDHFNPELFRIYKDRDDVKYILSSDIEKKVNEVKTQYGITDEQLDSISYVEPGKCYEYGDGAGKTITVETFLSTDEGVAFLISYDGKTVYHAGDLNWWAWDDNEPDYDKWMKDTYLGEVEKMSGRVVDIAFLPVDRRLEETIFLGADAYMRRVEVKKMFPIHMFGDFGVGRELAENEISEPYRDRIIDIDADGQEFILEL